MTDTSDKAIEAMADSLQAQSEHGLIGVPRGHVFVGFGQAADLILALQAERNQIAAEADARVKAAVVAEKDAAVMLVYEIIHESRHVTLGDKLVAAIRSRGVTG